MGWIISVGRAGAGTRTAADARAMSVRFDANGVALQLKVRELEDRLAAPAPDWQARRVWQKVLSTVVDID
jgi:hypothetical protein